MIFLNKLVIFTARCHIYCYAEIMMVANSARGTVSRKLNTKDYFFTAQEPNVIRKGKDEPGPKQKAVFSLSNLLYQRNVWMQKVYISSMGDMAKLEVLRS